MTKRKKSSTKVSCASTYRAFARKNLKKLIEKTGSAKAGMKAMAKEWKKCR